MSMGVFTFWFTLGCVMFLIAAAGLISVLVARSPETEITVRRIK